MVDNRLVLVVVFFFFQAEDGIRDLTVTGVQTCALPILAAQVQMSVYAIADHRTQVDASGQLTLAGHRYQVVFIPAALVFFALWVLSVGYQLVAWRRSAGDARQQHNWLMAGGAAALVSFIARRV